LVSDMRVEKKQNTQAENQRIVKIEMDIANFFSRVSVTALVRNVPHTPKFRHTYDLHYTKHMLLKLAANIWEGSYLIHFVMFSHAFQ